MSEQPEPDQEPQAPLPRLPGQPAFFNPPTSYAAPVRGGAGGLRSAWALSLADAEQPMDGTVISGNAFDAKVAGTLPKTAPRKVEPPAPKAAPEPAPAAEKAEDAEAAAKKVDVIKDVLSRGRLQGLNTLANDHLQGPAIKAWADD